MDRAPAFYQFSLEDSRKSRDRSPPGPFDISSFKAQIHKIFSNTKMSAFSSQHESKNKKQNSPSDFSPYEKFIYALDSK